MGRCGLGGRIKLSAATLGRIDRPIATPPDDFLVWGRGTGRTIHP